MPAPRVRFSMIVSSPLTTNPSVFLHRREAIHPLWPHQVYHDAPTGRLFACRNPYVLFHFQKTHSLLSLWSRAISLSQTFETGFPITDTQLPNIDLCLFEKCTLHVSTVSVLGCATLAGRTQTKLIYHLPPEKDRKPLISFSNYPLGD